MRRGRPAKTKLLCSAIALLAVTTRADDTAVTLVWYRSQEGCPDAAAFLARLEARGVRARIAQVGDAIDFVVTVGGGAEHGRGLLERQTRNGTVSVRLLEGGSCEEIVDGMALSLALASSPESSRASAPASVPEAVAGPPAKKPEAHEKTPQAPATGEAVATPPRPWAIAVQGTTVFGVGPSALFGGALFGSFAPGNYRILTPSFRLAGFGDFGAASEGGHDYALSLFGARLEGALILGWSAVHVNPLAALDLGALRAEGTGAEGQTDTAFWAAARGGVRAEVPLSETVELEAQIEGVVPFTRYHLRSAESPQESLYNTAPVGLAVGVGAGVRLP